MSHGTMQPPILDGLTVNPALISDATSLEFDESVVFDDTFNLDMLDNEPLFGDDLDSSRWNMVPTPPDRGLYSTPLSWDPPQQQLQIPQPLQTQPIFRPTMNTLTDAQREKLRSIAMPDHLQYNPFQSPGGSANSTQKSDSGSPDHNGHGQKRKSSAEAEDEDDDNDDDSHPPVKKTAHNMIEKRYRTNLNDKIAALRDSVPSLRVMTKNARGEDTTADREDLQGLTPAHKLNKATVLSKATEYIRHLEKRNKRLQDDNAAMKARIHAFEKLFYSSSMGVNPIQSPVTFNFQQPESYMSPNGQMTPGVSPDGLIEVPEEIRRMNAQVMRHNQQMYQGQERYIPTSQAQPAPTGWAGNGYFGKMMVGSLAGLMILEGFSEAEPQADEPAARGLFSVPVGLLRVLGNSLKTSTVFNSISSTESSATAYLGLKVMLLFGALFYIIAPLFTRPSSKPTTKTAAASLLPAPPLASSIHLRRLAWLTSVQTVWVPRHNFFLEVIALAIKAAKLSLRNAIGWTSYSMLTSTTPEQETARIKAWSIALDAQLGGGDVEISKGRLCLTLLASGTLPDTPMRLMMKALHVRVLLWELGNAGANGFFVFRKGAATLARWKWNEARQLQRAVSRSGALNTDFEPLPSHLAALLEQECDDVLSDSIGQRAHNLAWNQSTKHNTSGSSDGMDAVVSDFAISSPLDAVAAWFSSLTLESALSLSLTGSSSPEDTKFIENSLAIAIETAPIGSSAQARALVGRAILIDTRRGANIASAIQVLRPAGNTQQSEDNGISTSLFINEGLSISTLPDLKLALKCATVLAHLQREPVSDSAFTLIKSIQLPKLSLLGFVAAYKLILAISASQEVSEKCGQALEFLAGNLRIWIGGKAGLEAGLDTEVLESVVTGCTNISRKCVGLADTSKDDGYESMSAEDEGVGC